MEKSSFIKFLFFLLSIVGISLLVLYYNGIIFSDTSENKSPTDSNSGSPSDDPDFILPDSDKRKDKGKCKLEVIRAKNIKKIFTYNDQKVTFGIPEHIQEYMPISSCFRKKTGQSGTNICMDNESQLAYLVGGNTSFPTDYKAKKLILGDKPYQGSYYTEYRKNLIIWEPVCPSGYVSMGNVVSTPDDATKSLSDQIKTAIPPRNSVVCLPECAVEKIDINEINNYNNWIDNSNTVIGDYSNKNVSTWKTDFNSLIYKEENRTTPPAEIWKIKDKFLENV